MKSTLVRALIGALFSLLVFSGAAFAQGTTPTATPDAMMAATTTPNAMMAATAAPDAMMAATVTPDAMMAATAAPDAMMAATVTPATLPMTGSASAPWAAVVAGGATLILLAGLGLRFARRPR